MAENLFAAPHPALLMSADDSNYRHLQQGILTQWRHLLSQKFSVPATTVSLKRLAVATIRR
jgi:hypothetical protein